MVIACALKLQAQLVTALLVKLVVLLLLNDLNTGVNEIVCSSIFIIVFV